MRLVVLILAVVVAASIGAADRLPVIVTLHPPAAASADRGGQLAAIASAQRQILLRYDIAPTARWRNVAGFAAELTPDEIAVLRRDPAVASVDPDLPGHGALAESSALVGANVVRANGVTGRGVTVAVLDSGLDLTHPDFAGRIAGEQCFCRNANGTGCCPNGQTTQSGPGSANDDHGHGTNVTGILASGGAVSHPGIAPGVRIVAVKVLDRQNTFAAFSQVVSGFDWVLTNHPEVSVVNLSLLTAALFPGHCDGSFAAFAGLVDPFRARGGLVFACTGNNTSTMSMGSPACIERVVSVGAVHDVARTSYSAFGCVDAPASPDQVTCFTNRNGTMDLVAPGAAVTASGRGGGLSTFNGTSQATPHAAAAAALLMEVNPALPAAAIEGILKASGRLVAIPPAGHLVPRIDLPAAVEQAKPPAPGARRRRAVRP